MNFPLPEERHPLENHPNGAMPTGSKKGRLVRFYKKAVYMSHKSKVEGRPVHEERDFVEIISSPTHIVSREIRDETDEIVQEYPSVWRAYKEGQTDYFEGTRIDDYPALSVGQKEDLKALRIYTVEQLAEATDTMKQSFGPGGHALVQAAQAWLGKVESQSVVNEQAAKIQELELKIDAMQRVFEENSGKKVDTSVVDENAKLKAENEKLKAPKRKRAPAKKKEAE